MGSSGSGSSGKVTWPVYLTSIHYSMLSDSGAETLNFSMFDLLNEAFTSSPYTGIVTYTGRTEIGAVPLTVAGALGELLAFDFEVQTQFSVTLNALSTDVQNLFSTTLLQNSISKASDRAEPEYQRMTQVYDHLTIGAGFSSTRINGRVQLLDAKMRAVMKENLGDLSKGILQLGDTKLESALEVSQKQFEHIKISKTAYTMAIEMCKLTILNEREYTEQTEFYLKYGAHWRFECMQEAFNLLSCNFGGRHWIASPDIPAWGQGLALSLYASMGDVGSFNWYKNDKRSRSVLTSTGIGFIMGYIQGPQFAIVGGIQGMITGALNYTEGGFR